MAVYLSLTVAVVLLGMLIHNQEYVQFHTEPVSRRIQMPEGATGRSAGRLRGGLCRQQAFHIGVAVMIFILLTAVSACRIAVGNDYWVYRFQFDLIMQQRTVSYEMGFNAVVWIIQSLLGRDNYLPVFAFFSILTCFFFVKAMYDQGRWFAGTVFLLMTGGYYFSSLNSVRYYLVLAIAMYSMKYVLSGRYAMFILWIVIASLFHKSVLLVIPVYLVAIFLSKIRWKKWYVAVIVLLAAAAVLGEGLWRKIIFFFYPFYEGSAFDVRNLSWANIAKCVGTLLLCAICYKQVRESKRIRFYFFLNVGGLLLYTCCSFIPEISRVGYYFIVSQIFLLPDLLLGMKKGNLKRLCILGVGIAFLLYFALFLHQAYDVNIRLLPYLNWLFN